MDLRQLRFTASNAAVANARNEKHQFALGHAMMIYRPNALYSMIPKNACSTMRLSIALANGAIDDTRHWKWIHHNNDAFVPSSRDLATVSYRFVILRCPYARLVSCFLDKFVSRSTSAWKFKELVESAEDIDLPRLTFRQFCVHLADQRVRNADHHWRPQSQFLLYRDYTRIFCVEDFATLRDELKRKIGFDIVDARPLAKHDSSHFKTLPQTKSFADTEIWQIESMMMSGLRPDPASFYDDDLRELAAATYHQDFRLYREHFPGKGMFEVQPSGITAAAV